MPLTLESFSTSAFCPPIYSTCADFKKSDFLFEFLDIDSTEVLIKSEIKFHTNFIGTPDPYIKNIDSKRLDCVMKASSLGYAIFKCIIPKGTEYLSGTYLGHGANACVLSMCTKSLVFKEKVMEIRDTLNKLELQHLIKKALNL